MEDIDAAKRALRASARARRKAAHGARQVQAAELVCARIIALRAVWAGVTVALYWPMRDELDVRPLLTRLGELGAVTALPTIVARDLALVFRRFAPGEKLVDGVFGTQEPTPAAPAVVPTVAVVPLLGFDRMGYRLGYGGGYYDRTLAALRLDGGSIQAIGAAYHEQEFTVIPHDSSDARLDLIITDRETITP
jgi:5-formyltetrahydrofolate cyclo-ligase